MWRLDPRNCPVRWRKFRTCSVRWTSQHLLRRPTREGRRDWSRPPAALPRGLVEREATQIHSTRSRSKVEKVGADTSIDGVIARRCEIEGAQRGRLAYTRRPLLYWVGARHDGRIAAAAADDAAAAGAAADLGENV